MADPMVTQRPYLEVGEIAELFGISTQSVTNAVNLGHFPVPSYKLGKRRVWDRAVVTQFFEAKQLEGMNQLKARAK